MLAGVSPQDVQQVGAMVPAPQEKLKGLRRPLRPHKSRLSLHAWKGEEGPEGRRASGRIAGGGGGAPLARACCWPWLHEDPRECGDCVGCQWLRRCVPLLCARPWSGAGVGSVPGRAWL